MGQAGLHKNFGQQIGRMSNSEYVHGPGTYARDRVIAA